MHDNEIKDGGSAFPCEQGHTPEGSWNQSFDPGMSLRDYFAAKAMQALASESHDELQEASGEYEERTTFQLLASAAYQIADAMLKARQA